MKFIYNAQSPFSALTLLVGRQEGIRPVKKNWVLVCWWQHFARSVLHLIAPVVTTTSIILSSNKIQKDTFWYWLTQVHLGC